MKQAKQTNSLGARLVQMRKAQGLTQQQLAEQLGVTRRAIVYYEREADSLPTNILEPMARALKVSIAEVIGIKPTKETVNPAHAALWRKLKVLETFSEKDRKAVLHYVDALAGKNKTKKDKTES